MNAHNKCRNLNTMRTIRITLKVLSALKNFKAFWIFSGYYAWMLLAFSQWLCEFFSFINDEVVPFIVASNTPVAWVAIRNKSVWK